MKNLILTILSIFILLSVFAQDEASDLEKKIQNPIASLISVPFQNNTDFGIGNHNRSRNTLNIQPVVPFSLSEGVNLITRTIIPILSQPIGEDNSQSGLGDINLSLFFTPAKPGKVIYGGGLAMGLPTATHDYLGSEKFNLGPSIVALVQPGTWTIGGLMQNIWSVAGNEERADVNFFFTQIFVTKNLAKGWYINSAPIITANWKADSENQWTFPIGAGGGRLFRLGKLPVNAQAGYYRNVVKPEGGPDSQMRFQLTFLFPK